MAKRGKKKTSKKTAKRGRKTTAKRAPRSAGAALESMTVSELQAELNRRRRGVARLERRREKLSAELAAVNAEIAELGGSLTGGTGTRARNSMTLPDALHQVLQGVTMSVTEAADAVRAAGYSSSAANFRTMVNQALLKDKRFKKVSRGQYTAA
jgi:septal ring factor EnvC (AmiA/AmiB activator)